VLVDLQDPSVRWSQGQRDQRSERCTGDDDVM
jgi:hypothetical protein